MTKLQRDKVTSVIVLLLIVFVSLWFSRCSTSVPPPPSDYIDDTDTTNFVYIKYIPDWYIVPDKLEDRLILPIHFIDEVDMSNYA